MDTPLVYYFNLGFAWFLVLLSIWGFSVVLRKTGRKMLYWLFFGLGWGLIGVSHILILLGISSAEWYMLAIRIAGYASIVISVLALMVHLVERDA